MPLSRSWPTSSRRSSRSCASVVQERAATLAEAAALVEFLFAPELVVEDDSFDKAIARDPDAGSILAEARQRLEKSDFQAAALKAEILELAERRGRKLGKAQAPIRVAALGRTVGLPLFESLEVLGRDRTLERLDAAIGAPQWLTKLGARRRIGRRTGCRAASPPLRRRGREPGLLR